MDPTTRQAIRDFVESADELDDETRAALLERVPEPELRPRVVRVAWARVTVDRKTGDRRHRGAMHCPDCGRGLTSRGTDLICPQLPLTLELAGDLDAGRVVACGEGRTRG